ncbi:pyridoxal-phosphate dependent enzyme [Helicobacter jaachi]|uniref:Pyridoxal-phosphate dependent enzyme n=1 Tax=Helicobacter jaachi TaxID=1677920 RepID=A0A4U8T9Y6_9HELI|nr:pyridoxal-phosphate dependent enzyme [Helicobacter jaachi]TLD96595.1 pyridoxal-phosphate dependent enzyme [Helicobacter jaachi]
MLDFSRSIIESRLLFDYPFLLKRDDLIHPYCNGNKARKFAALLQNQYHQNIWLSYGGNQSNAMASLAYLAHIKGATFHYVMPKATFAPKGNLAFALKCGMRAHTLPVGSSVEHLKSYAHSLLTPKTLFIPQGGDVQMAYYGMRALACELKQSIEKQGRGSGVIIFYTSGSGVGVVALKKALDLLYPQASLVALNCAKADLCALFDSHNVSAPIILESPFIFAKPKIAIWDMQSYLKSHNVRCDIIYDSVGFYMLRQHLHAFKGYKLVFIHSGGLMGNLSQLPRYAHILNPAHKRSQKV